MATLKTHKNWKDIFSAGNQSEISSGKEPTKLKHENPFTNFPQNVKNGVLFSNSSSLDESIGVEGKRRKFFFVKILKEIEKRINDLNGLIKK